MNANPIDSRQMQHHPAAGLPRARRAPASPRAQRGVTLVEILVAAVLLAVGLLGLAGLQLRGVQVNQGSQFRSQAEILAEDLADQMRADPLDAKQIATPGGFYGTFTPAAGAANASTVASMNAWLAQVASLPRGTVSQGVTDASATLPATCASQLPCVVVQPLSGVTAPTPIQIGIFWNDARAAIGAAAPALAAGGTNPNGTSQVGFYTTVAELSGSY